MKDKRQSVCQKNTTAVCGQRVFNCGHSFHGWVGPMLKELAGAAGIAGHEFAGTAGVGGGAAVGPYLDHMWGIPDGENAARKALRAGKVDVLTLSPIWLPDPGIEKFTKLALENNPAARVTIQEFWLPNDACDPSYPLKHAAGVNHNKAAIAELRQRHEPYFQSLEDNVREVNRLCGRPVVSAVPVGHAVLSLREKIVAGQALPLKEQEDIFADCVGHPRQPVQALVAYCHFAVIYRRSPVGLPIPGEEAFPDVWQWQWKGDWRNSSLHHLLQELAWEAVIHHPLSGI
jgi:hypothetical protein